MTTTGRSFGKAGASLSSKNSGGKKYAKTARVGAAGERQLAKAFSADPVIKNAMSWASLKIPYKSGQRRYDSDVDFAVASGKTLVLVDAKAWKGGVHYWSFFGKIMENFSVSDKKTSQNMKLARTRYREALPGDHKVIAMTVFVRTGRGNLPASVAMLRFPGGIKSYLLGGGLRRIGKYVGPEPAAASPQIQGLLGKMLRDQH